jgi:formylmethanofuran dehydrogenase subunit B
MTRGPVTCAGCGLLCDDVTVQRSGDELLLDPPCGLGARWFSERVRRPANLPAATIGGHPAVVDAALSRAAELLRGARRPLVHGFDGATVEDARAAVGLGDRLGAVVATGRLGGPWPGAPSLPLRGASTATLGEIRDRSRVVVIWREDPESTHPRLLERLGFGGSGQRHPRAQRTLVVVDERDTPTAQRADLHLRWPRERDLEALTGLHVLARRLTLPAGTLASELGDLLERIDAVAHAAFVHGPGLTAGAGGERRTLALQELVRELCRARHVVTLALPTAAGTRGAQDVLAWQTGYFENVDLASGHPEPVIAPLPLDAAHGGGELAVGIDGADVAVCIECAAGEPAADATSIVLSALPVEDVEVWIRTAAAGVEAAGTAHRLDGIPLTLQAPLPSDAPTAASMLARLLAEIGQ